MDDCETDVQGCHQWWQCQEWDSLCLCGNCGNCEQVEIVLVCVRIHC